MTEPQKEIFLAAKLGDDASCAFNESFSVYLRGELKVDALRDALNTVIARHEALRATVDPEGELLHFASELKLELHKRGIETRPIICGNMARQPAMSHVSHRVSGDLKGADKIMDCGLLWGLHPLMSAQDVDYVADTVLELSARL